MNMVGICPTMTNKIPVCLVENQYLEETYMVDFIVNVFAEIADFFINFWADNVIDKLVKRNK